ncbi:MAG: SpoIIE family protein phosphatase [Blastocatellia bacterium]|nr:SpoIIE family protein phosphatase [Blastocatellia bacterium]
MLIGFTDGLSEALNVEGEEFGEERIRATLAATTGLAINNIRDEVVQQANLWCAGAPQHDDLTFIVMKLKA